MQAYTISFPFSASFSAPAPDTTVVVEGGAKTGETPAVETVTPEEVAEYNKALEEYPTLELKKDTYTKSEVEALIKVAYRKPSPVPLLPATSEIVWGTISFLVVFAALAKFGIPAARKAIEARTAKIEGDLKAAAAAKADAEKEGATYRAQLGDAKGEGAKIVEDARAQAETTRKEILGRAEAEATDIKAKATAEANAQGDRVKVELQSHVRGLSIDLAEKVVGKNLDRATNEALVDKYISELAAN